MRYAYWLVPVVSLVGLAAVGSLLGASASFSFRHPQDPNVKFVISGSGGVRLEEYEKAQAHRPLGESSAVAAAHDALRVGGVPPRAVAEQTVYDFGTMNPLTVGEHRFTIRNEGAGALLLRSGGTTCKCTLAKLPTQPIAPGESAEVRLQWNTGRDPSYDHGATILTNDPQRPRIELRVEGRVQVLCDAIPSEVTFPAQDPDCTSTARVEIYSRTWDRFEITGGSSNVMGVTWNAQPLASQRCQELSATCGYVVELTAPADLPKGEFQGVLQLNLLPESEGESLEPRVFEIEFSGQMHSRLTVFGTSQGDADVIQLGTVSTGQSLHRRLVMRVRDRQLPTVDEIHIQTDPPHLEATVTRKESSSVSGLYLLDLRVPAGAPAGAYTGVRQASVRIAVDHPRLEALQLPVEFAVLGEPHAQ